MRVSSNVARLQPSATLVLSTRVRALIAAGADVIDLSVGEPDQPTPSFIARAGIAAIRAGRTRYTSAAGIPELRAAIAADLHRLSPAAPSVDPAGIVVSGGAKQALFNACFTLFGPGDRVLIPVPFWTSYPALVELARAEPVFVQGAEERGFRVTPDDLERASEGGGVRGLLLNSPCNPTGAVYSHPELRAIAEWAAERDVWVISDEIYRRIFRGGPLAPGLLDLPPELLERTVVVDGASKAFAMTGWRIGFSYSSPALAGKLTALQSQTTSHPSTPSQWAALAAYRAGEEEEEAFRTMASTFRNRLERVVDLFREHLPRVRFVEPQGAFYLFFRAEALARAGEDSAAVCARLLEQAGVALVPGEAFGDERFIRLSYACSEETLRDAVRRIARVTGD